MTEIVDSHNHKYADIWRKPSKERIAGRPSGEPVKPII